MSEDLYAKPDLSRKVPAQVQRTEKSTGAGLEDHGDRDSHIYDNNVTQRGPEDLAEEHQTAASVRVGSGTSVKVLLALLCFLLLAVVVVMVTLSVEWRRDSSSQQEQLWRSLGELRGNLSRYSSSAHHLLANLSSLEKNLELHQAEMEAIVSSLNATIQNLTKPCPPCWTPYRGKCYLRSTSQRSWDDSRKFCQRHNADLVVVSDLDKQLFITSTFDPDFWIGVSLERTPSKIWKGVNGEEITTTFWATGEPNDSQGKESCVVSLRYSSETTWNDAACSKAEFCVCEKTVP